MTVSPFHDGEKRVQERLGVREAIEPWARKVVHPTLPEQHRQFYAQLPYVVAAARDDAGRPWVTILAGSPGFISSPDPGTMKLSASPASGDALAGALNPGADVGLLGIELHSRRRNRVNGRVADSTARGLELEVEQSFGNCPQYITDRRWWPAEADKTGAGRRSTRLDERQRRLVAAADTFFIATGYRGSGENAAFGMDASHRGGPPGFVELLDDGHLMFPDYSGNNHFNTIGNLAADDRAGLLFVDFERGDLLQLTGRATIDWTPSDRQRAAGAMRGVRFELEEVVEQSGVLPLRFGRVEDDERIELVLTQKIQESPDVTSFVFAREDAEELPEFQPGQYLPIELRIPGQSNAVARTYSLSGALDGRHYRISVKRESMGLASRYLHDHVQVGDRILAEAPRGEFVLPPVIERPVVLVSAGVGITPMVSMLHDLAGNGEVATWFVHGARDEDHFALREEVERVAHGAKHVRFHAAYSRADVGDSSVGTYSRGRVDADLLEELVPGLDADFWMCGPVTFLSSLHEGLIERGVPAERIHYETFGPIAGGKAGGAEGG